MYKYIKLKKFLISTHIMLTVIHLDFTLEQYIVMESEGYIPIGIMLSGGTAISSITVLVTPAEQSPLSATGTVGHVIHVIN